MHKVYHEDHKGHEVKNNVLTFVFPTPAIATRSGEAGGFVLFVVNEKILIYQNKYYHEGHKGHEVGN